MLPLAGDFVSRTTNNEYNNNEYMSANGQTFDDQGPLPPGWKTRMDPVENRRCYYNRGTNQTQWTRPNAVEERMSATMDPCPICYDALDDSNSVVVCWNSHTLCSGCYDRCLADSRSSNKNCSICRVKMFDWSPDKDPTTGTRLVAASVAPAAQPRRQHRCGNCGVAGHNRRTCPQLRDVRAAAGGEAPVDDSGIRRRTPSQVTALTDVGGNWRWEYTNERDFLSLLRRFGPCTPMEDRWVYGYDGRPAEQNLEIFWVLDHQNNPYIRAPWFVTQGVVAIRADMVDEV